MSNTRLLLTSVLGACQLSPVGDGAPLRQTLQIRCKNVKFRFRKRPCPRLCGKARNPSRCAACNCHVKAFNCPPDAQITPDGAKKDLLRPPNPPQASPKTRFGSATTTLHQGPTNHQQPTKDQGARCIEGVAGDLAAGVFNNLAARSSQSASK